MFNCKTLQWMLLCTVSTSVSAAFPDLNVFSHPEFTAAIGASWANAGDTTLRVSPYETDAIKVHDHSTDFVWRVGAGVHVMEEQLAARQYLNDLSLQLNFYNSAATLNGDVWQYQLPQFNNYSFHASATNSRFMFDVKPGLGTWNHVTPYLIGGVGLGWNSIGYYEARTTSDVPANSSYSLRRHSNLNAAYDVGAGVKRQVTPHLTAVLEYEYTYLGRMAPSSVSPSVALISSPHFTLSTQNLWVGVNWQV